MRQFSFGISPFTDVSFPGASFPGALESGSLAKVGAFLVEGSFSLGIDRRVLKRYKIGDGWDFGLS